MRTRTAGARRKGGPGPLKFALWALGVLALLLATAYVTLRVALNRPRVREAVCGWLSRTTGCEATYGQLVPKAFPWRLAMTRPHLSAPGLDVRAESVELVLQLRPADIREVRVIGAEVRVEWTAGELARRAARLCQRGPSSAERWETMPPVVAENAVLAWAPGGKPGFELRGCEFRAGAWGGDTPLEASFRGNLGAAANRVAVDFSAAAPSDWWPHPGECPLRVRVESLVDDLPAAANAAPPLATAGLERPGAWFNAVGIPAHGLTVSGAFSDGPPHRTPPRSVQFEGTCRLPDRDGPWEQALEADLHVTVPAFRWRRFDLRGAQADATLRDGLLVLATQPAADAPLRIRHLDAGVLPAVLRAAAAP